MSENITLNTSDKTAMSVVRYVRDRGRVVYTDYIAEHGVTLDTVGAHVAALQSLAFPKFDSKTATDADKMARKYFGNTVRNGLNYTLGKGKFETSASDKFATALALKCDDRDAAVAKFLSEWDAAHAGA